MRPFVRAGERAVSRADKARVLSYDGRPVLPTKGTRKIVVRGRAFYWRARHVVLSGTGAGGQPCSWDTATVVIRPADGGGARTVRFDARDIDVTGWGLKGAQILPITPRLVRALIEEALAAGWGPEAVEVPASIAACDILRNHPDTGRTGVRAGAQPGRYQR